MRYTVLIKQLDANTFGYEGSLKHKRMNTQIKNAVRIEIWIWSVDSMIL